MHFRHQRSPSQVNRYYPKGKPQRAERVSGDRAPGLPALWEGEGPDHTSRAQGKEDSPPPPYSLCRKHGCQYATINKFWAWPCKAVFRYMPKGLPRQGGGLQEMVCVSFLERPLLLCVLVPFSSPSQTLCWPSRSITYHSFCVWQSVMKDTEQNTGDTWWPWIQTVLSCGQKQRNFHVPWQDSTVKERAAYLHPSQS